LVVAHIPINFPLSLHDALPIFREARVRRPMSAISSSRCWKLKGATHKPLNSDAMGLPTLRHFSIARISSSISSAGGSISSPDTRSEEHTSELQSRENLVCRLLL